MAPPETGDYTNPTQPQPSPAAEYSVPQRLLADAQLALAPLTNPQQVWDGTVVRAQQIAADPLTAGKELVQAAPAAVGTGVCLALAARSPGRIGATANWLLKSKGGIAAMTVGTPYLFAAPQFIDTFANPQNLAVNEQAFAQSFGGSLTDGALFTGIAVGAGRVASVGMQRLGQRRSGGLAAPEDSVVSRTAETPVEEVKPKATQDPIADQISEANRHRYSDLVEQRRLTVKNTDLVRFDEFEALAQDGNSPSVDMTKLTALLDENFGGYFDQRVKSWARDHKGTRVGDFIESYFADPDKQFARLKTSTEKMMNKAADQTTDLDAAQEMRNAMWRFEGRAKIGLLDQKEVEAGLRTINLLYKQGHTELAVQGLMQAADPRLITQSTHPTCTLTSMEVWMYSKQPSVALDAIYNLATQGKSGATFASTHGTDIHLDAFTVKPESGALNLFDPKARSYASQLFQSLAANIVHQPKGVTYEFAKQPLPNGGYLREDAVFETVQGQKVPSRVSLGFASSAAKWAAEGMGATKSMTIIDPNQYPNFKAFEQAMLALRPNDFPALIVVDAGPLKQPFAMPFELNHSVPIFDINHFGRKLVAFQDNWGFDRDPANRGRQMSLQNMWALAKPSVATKYWNPFIP